MLAVTATLALASFAAGCGGPGAHYPVYVLEPPPAITAEVPPAPAVEEVEPYIPAEPDPERWPLSGVEAEVEPRPALLVKVENTPRARPQAGLEYADIVYEQILEGGISRFLAVYNSIIPNAIYPVRSARSIDLGLVLPYRGVFAYSGAMPQFTQMFNNTGIQSLTFDRGSAGFYRVSGRPALHSVAINPEVILSQADAYRDAPPPQMLRFAESPAMASAANGNPASHIRAVMSAAQTTNWTWDEVSSRFSRSNGNAPSVAANGARHQADNLIFVDVLKVPTGMRDSAGSSIPEVYWDNTGPALFATNGNYIEGYWVKPDYWTPFSFYDLSGDPVTFAPGATWIHLVPRGSGSWTVTE